MKKKTLKELKKLSENMPNAKKAYRQGKRVYKSFNVFKREEFNKTQVEETFLGD